MITIAASFGSSEEYILTRVLKYDQVIMNKRNNKILSFQFLQQFFLDDAIYIYHGPVFSINRGFLSLFDQYISELCSMHKGKNIFLMAEIQNPAMLMVLHGLFGPYGYSVLSKKVPAEVLDAMLIICNEYPHIGRFNPVTITTTTTGSLYKCTKSYNELTDFLEERNVHLSYGDSVLFSVMIPAKQLKRKKILKEMQQGLKKVSSWSMYKKTFFEHLQAIAV